MYKTATTLSPSDLVRDHINAVAVVQLRVINLNIEMCGFESLGQGW